MNNVELYWNGDHSEYAVLVSYGFGAGWSTWNVSELAYDKRVVNFWLDHKDNKEWMKTVDNFGFGSTKESQAHKEAAEFFKSIGYGDVYMGGFFDIELEWIPRGTKWRISEYDGAESIEIERNDTWNCF